VAAGPNFEGHSILHVPRPPVAVAERLGISVERLGEHIVRARGILLAARDKRVHPGLDNKVLAAWNGLMLTAFAEAGRSLERADYLAAAARSADFLTSQMVVGGRLHRSWKDGRAHILGYLEDHAAVGAGLLDAYEATFDRRWLDHSRALAEEALRLFWDETKDAFFDTGSDQEALVVRPRSLFDNAVPSGTAVTIEWLLRLAAHLGEDRYERQALRALRPMADLMRRYPTGFGRYLAALDFHLGPVPEIALVWPAGPEGEAAAAPLLERVFGRYLPNRVVAGMADGAKEAAALPLLAGKRAEGGRATAYLCRKYVCQAPTSDPDALARQLDGGV
jgi:uncharacterized protein YyaL (SSP411 family)